RVVVDEEDDGNRRGCGLGRQHRNGTPGRDDHGHLPANQVTRQGRQSIQVIIGPAILDDDVLTLDKASFFEALAKSTQTVLDHRARRSVVEEADHRHRRLLRTRRDRPRRSAAESTDEIATSHGPPSTRAAYPYHGRLRCASQQNWTHYFRS